LSERDLFADAIDGFLKPIKHLLDDESVSEVMINGPKEVFVERAGKLFRADAEFADEDSLVAAVNNIAQSVGRVIDSAHPTLDARLPAPWNYRVHAVIPPCARNGTTVAIRKFTKTQMTFKDYVKRKTITPEAAQFLDLSVFLGKNILVSGGTGSGKTTLLSVLAGRIPPGQRVIVIEDASELTVEYEHVVFFETKMADEQGIGEITIRDLLKSSLRLRPDRIIVGEVRSSEALELISAMNTGHKGCFGTIHSNSPQDALVRLEALALGGDSKISEKAICQQIASAIDLVVQISRFPDGSRRIQSICEVTGLGNDGKYIVHPIFELGNLKRQADGTLVGELSPTGHLPSFMEEIEDNKIPFSRERFQKKAS
jgi:pilus assembly protein CpaF